MNDRKMKAVGFVLCLVMVMGLLLAMPKTVKAEDIPGAGTDADPYRISTEEQLREFANRINGTNPKKDACARLENDIDLGGIDVNGTGIPEKEWIPIGTDGYEGTFDGNGYTISGVYVNIEKTGNDNIYSGLFGKITSGTVKNLTVKGLVKSSYGDSGISGEPLLCTGGIAGVANGAALENCVSDCKVMTEVDRGSPDHSIIVRTGGIAGYALNTNIKDCKATEEVSASNIANATDPQAKFYTGGIAGMSENGEVEGCSSLAEVSIVESGNSWSYTYTGGIIGLIDGGSVKDCHSEGAVTASGGTDLKAGGIAGCVKNDGKIENCSFQSSVLADHPRQNGYAGGIVACNDLFSCSKVEKCSFNGSVTVKNVIEGISIAAGGVEGYNNNNEATVECCSSEGTVTLSDNHVNNMYTGGVSGYNEGVVRNCYSTCDISVERSGGEPSTYNQYGVNTGGIAGMIFPMDATGRIQDCYFYGDISLTDTTGTISTGGINGLYNNLDNKEAVKDCCYNESPDYKGIGSVNDTFPEKDEQGITKALSVDGFAKRESFDGWNFSYIWTMDGEKGRPVFRFRNGVEDDPLDASAWSDLYEALLYDKNGDPVYIKMNSDDAVFGSGAYDQPLPEIPANKKIILDLNGHTIDRSCAGSDAKDDGGMFSVAGELTLTDSAPDTVHDPAVTYTVPNTDESVTVTGGIITGGNSTGNGGGVFVDEGATFVMKGCTICNNGAASGGGVYVRAGGKFSIEGTASVCGNENAGNPDNVHLDDAVMIDITGPISGRIAVNRTDEFTRGYGTYMNGADPARFFVCDMKNMIACFSTATGEVRFKKVLSAVANMKGYTYGGEVSKPAVTGNTGNGEVAFYYNTEKKNTGGKPFSGFTNTTLDAGTYYLYATVSETDEYGPAVTDPVKFSVAKKAASVAANDQTVSQGVDIKTGPDNAILEGAVNGHYLDSVTLVSSPSGKVADTGTITPSAAVIKDKDGRVVTQNYEITYRDGKFTVTASTVYSVKVTTDKHGSASATPTSGITGTKITIKAVSDAGYKFRKWKVVSGGVKLSDATKAKTTFKIKNANVKVKAIFEKIYEEPQPDIEPVDDDKIILAWFKVNEAKGYDIFMSRCDHDGKEITPKLIKTIKNKKTTQWTVTGLKPNKSYKALIKAYTKDKNGKKKYISKSPLMHVYTAGGNKTYTNAKSVKLDKSDGKIKKGNKLTLKVKDTYKIKASVKKADKKKKLMPDSHVKTIRYRSSDPGVATVSSKGKITAKKKGKCNIYVYAHNGVNKTIKVTVK